VDVSFIMGIYNGKLCFFFPSFSNYVGYEKLTTIYNHHIKNTLNRRTSITFHFDIFLLSYLLFSIANLCCIVLKYVDVNL
jgi:ABC-type uncharacterized transport system permease subunit